MLVPLGLLLAGACRREKTSGSILHHLTALIAHSYGSVRRVGLPENSLWWRSRNQRLAGLHGRLLGPRNDYRLRLQASNFLLQLSIDSLSDLPNGIEGVVDDRSHRALKYAHTLILPVRLVDFDELSGRVSVVAAVREILLSGTYSFLVG